MAYVKIGEEYRVIGRLIDADNIIRDGKGLNYGKVVVPISFSGYFNELGNVWKCKGSNLVSYGGLIADALDFPEDCLEPLVKSNPEKLKKEETV